jgi:hypothetical protein
MLTFTITLGNQAESVRWQVQKQGIKLSFRQLQEFDELDSNDCSLSAMEESGVLTASQVAIARKKLLRRMLLVIGGGEL